MSQSDVLHFEDVMLKTGCTPLHTLLFYKLNLPSVDPHMITNHTKIDYQLSDTSFMSLFQIVTLLLDIPVKPCCLEWDVFATTFKQDNDQLYDSKTKKKQSEET